MEPSESAQSKRVLAARTAGFGTGAAAVKANLAGVATEESSESVVASSFSAEGAAEAVKGRLVGAAVLAAGLVRGASS